jgi:hypothetical protein
MILIFIVASFILFLFVFMRMHFIIKRICLIEQSVKTLSDINKSIIEIIKRSKK